MDRGMILFDKLITYLSSFFLSVSVSVCLCVCLSHFLSLCLSVSLLLSVSVSACVSVSLDISVYWMPQNNVNYEKSNVQISNYINVLLKFLKQKVRPFLDELVFVLFQG